VRKNTSSLFRFEVSPWFEALFALQVVTDDGSRIHESWKKAALERMPASFHKKFVQIGGSSFIWPMIADCALDTSLSVPFEERIARIAALPAKELQETIFLGVLHEPRPVRQLLSGRYDLFETIKHVSPVKREWLVFIGLYPPARNAPLFRGLETLLYKPVEFRRLVAELLEIFWTREFKQTWARLEKRLNQSREEKERLFHSCSLDEFLKLTLLRIEVDERKRILRAVRGGYTLPMKHLSAGVILPSAFNDRRHWTTWERDSRAVVAYFPYFDPAISLSQISRDRETSPGEPEPDPALIFKALGDATRYAMVSLLAKQPHTSADLAKALALSRPTVSHHIHFLREAGLLDEKIQGNTVKLSLRRESFEDLSRLVISKLFHSTTQIDLKKTRNK